MRTDTPQSASPPSPGAPLKDLPAQPVNEKEAEGVKGGSTQSPPVTGGTP